MPLFGSRSTYHDHDRDRDAAPRHRRGFFHRRDRDRVAGGYKAALTNPNTTRSGRRHAKRELFARGRGNETHVPLMTKIKRALGIRSTPRHRRTLDNRTRY